MLGPIRRALFILGLTSVLLAYADPAHAAVMFVNDRADLVSHDSVDWGFLGPPGTGLRGQFPFSATSAKGLGITVSGTHISTYESIETSTLNNAASILARSHRSGVFSLGAATQLRLLFDNPVQGVGADILAETFSTVSNPYTAELRVDVFSLSGLLASQTFGSPFGSSPQTAFDGFVGVLSDSANISTVAFHLRSIRNSQGNWRDRATLNLGQVEFGTQAAPAAGAVPEPGSLTLWIVAGGLGMAVVLRRRQNAPRRTMG